MAEDTLIFTHEALYIYGSRVVLGGVFNVGEMYWDNTKACDLT